MVKKALWTVLTVVPCMFGQATFHGNLAHTGVYDSTGPRQLKGVKWVFKTDGPVLSSPTISDGVVFFGSSDGKAYAVDEETGKQKWSYKSGLPVSSSLAVAGGLIYFSSYGATLNALDAATGNVAWTFTAEREHKFQAKSLDGYAIFSSNDQIIPDAWDFFTSSPGVLNGRVYFGSGDGNVYCLDAHTGALVWKFATGDVVHASPAIANGTIYIGSWDGYFYAIAADTGQEKWRYKAGEDPVFHNQVGFQSSAAIVDGVVYVGCRDGHVYAFDAATGRKKWDYSTSQSWVNTTPAVRDGVVYAGSCDSGRFHALDAKSGRLRFAIEAKTCLDSSPALAGDMAYIGNFSGRLFAIDIKATKVAWEFQTEASKQDRFKVLDPDGSYHGASYANTQIFHDFEDMYMSMSLVFSTGAIISSPAVDKGVVYVGSTDGNLYALE